MEESNERHYRRACKRLLGTQELWDESARHGDVSPGLQLLKGHALERLKFLGKQQEKLYHLPMLESAAEVRGYCFVACCVVCLTTLFCR